jgi:hypothetical protein
MRVLQLAARQKQLFPLEDLLAATTYPAEERNELFYAQSLSLVRFLIRRTSYKRFLSFLQRLDTPDDWAAWRRHLRVRSASHLENIWRREAIEGTGGRS